jgi:short-subunit dehydrogenase
MTDGRCAFGEEIVKYDWRGDTRRAGGEIGIMRIQGSVAVVTGASSGIGREAALALARRGASVALVARRQDALDEVAREARAFGGRVAVVVCDVSVAAEVHRAAELVRRELGEVDLLVQCAGLGVWRRFFDISDDEHQRMMAVNYWGTFNWIRALLPEMRRRRCGAIVNVVAGSGKFAFPSTSGFSASKFAVAGLTEALRRELTGSGVTVSSVFPGSVRTEFWNPARVDLASLPPLVRYAPKLSAESVARSIVWVARLGLAERTLPVFVAFIARVNAMWSRLGDLLLWPWLLPATAAIVALRYLMAVAF